MHRHDRFRPRRHPPQRILRIDVPGVALDVGEDRPRARVEDRVRRGDERIGRTDHLVVGSDAGEQQREMQRGGARRRGDAVARADPRGELFLEARDRGTLARPAARQHVGHGACFRLIEVGAGERDVAKRGAHDRAAERCSCHQATSDRSPCSSGIAVWKPSCRRAASTDACRFETAFTLRGGLYSGRSGILDRQQQVRQLVQRGLDAAADVEDHVGQRRRVAASMLARAMSATCTKSISRCRRRRSSAAARRRSPPSIGSALRVDAVDVHPRTVDVEVAQRDVVEAVSR